MRNFVRLISVFSIFLFTTQLGAIGWDDGYANDHYWHSPNNWEGDVLPANGQAADITTAQSQSPTNPIITQGDTIPATGYLTHIIVGNDSTPNSVDPHLLIEGGTINTEWLNIAWDTDPTVYSSVELTDGTINLQNGAGHLALGITTGGGQAYFKQTGGIVDCKVAVFCWDSAPAHADLLGGTFQAGDIHLWPDGSVKIDGGTLILNGDIYYSTGANIDINDGEFIITGDRTADIPGWEPASLLTAYNGAGQIIYNYDLANPGKTTITALGPRAATSPSPADNELKAQDDEVLSWTPDAAATSYDIFFGTNYNDVMDASRLVGDADGDGFVGVADLGIITNVWLEDPTGQIPYPDLDRDDNVDLFDFSLIAADWFDTAPQVFKGNQTQTTYTPASLDLYTTYYWRVDQIVGSEIIKGKVWSFKPTIPSSLGRGHKIFLKRGLLTSAVVFPNNFGYAGGVPHDNIDWDTWYDSKFNTVCTHSSWLDWLTGTYGMVGPNDVYYSRWCEGQSDLLNGAGNGMLSWQEEIYVGDNLVALQAADEENLNDTGWRNAIKAAFDRWKAAYPDTLVYTTQNGPSNEGGIDDFQKFAQPDMSYMFTYEFKSGGSLNQMYKSLRDFREHGKKGIGATDYSEPIPYGMYFQSMNLQDRHIGQSEICLGMFTPIAYGYKMINAFVYARNSAIAPDNDIRAELFEDGGDSIRRPLFDIAAENNRQINLMSNTLVRLSSTGIYDINGESYYIPDFSAYDISYISGISSQDNADVVVSKFQPLHEAFDGPSYDNQTYFMVINANAPVDGTPADAAKDITLNFDFGSSGITSLQSINLTTGVVGTVTLNYLGGTQYNLTVILDGGRGKLYKFNTGAPFVGFYDGQ